MVDKEPLSNIDVDNIYLDVQLLLAGRLKMQTLHNRVSKSLKDKDVDLYLRTMIAKSYYKFIITNKGE